MNSKLNNMIVATIVLTTLVAPLSAQAATTTKVITTTNTEFVDLHLAADWARDAIVQVQANGVVSGDPSGQFRPQDSITRAEMAVVLVKALGLDVQASAEAVFSDVASTHWAHQSIAALYNAGVINGDGTGTFRPQDKVTREELAIMLVKALFKTPTNTGITMNFADGDKIHEWAKQYVQTAVDHGLMRGDGTNFNPQQQAKRQEIAVIVMNMLNQASTIETVTDDSVAINGVTYSIGDSLKGLFNTKNSVALEGSTVKFEAVGGKITKVTFLELTNGGMAAEAGAAEFSNNLVLDAQNATINGAVKVSANYITLKNLKITGDLEITKELQNDFYSDNLQVSGQTIVNGGDTNTVVFNNANLGAVVVNKPEVRVEPTGKTTVSEITVNSNANITAGADVVIPKLTVAENAAHVEINAAIDALVVTSKQETTLTGTSDIKELTVSSANALSVNTTGTIGKLAATDAGAKLTLKAGAKVDNLVLPDGAKASDVIQNYEASKGQFGKVNNETNPDATPAPAPTAPSTPYVPTPPPADPAPPVTNVQVTGKVVDEAGNPVAGAYIMIVKFANTDEDVYVSGVTTDAQGVYKISGLTTSGTYHIRADAPDTAPNLAGSLATQFNFDAASSAVVTNADLKILKTEMRVSVFNIDGITKADQVSLHMYSMEHVDKQWLVSRDANGFKLANLQEGAEYSIVARPEAGIDAVSSPTTRFVYQAGQGVMEKELRLSAVQMDGTVITPTGAPLAHASVEMREKMTEGAHWQQTITDADGKYKFGNLKQGVTYEIAVFPEPGSEYVQPATPVEFVYQGQRTTVPAISVILPNMEGTVLTSLGTPATSFTRILITDVPAPGTFPKFYYDVFTDENGKFRTFLLDGTYQLQAFSDNAEEADSLPMTVIVQNGVVNNAAPQLVLAKTLVKGLVLNEAGQPMQFGHVQLQDANGHIVASDHLSHNGEFAIGNVPDGNYTLHLEQFFPEVDEVLTPVPVSIVNQTPVNLNTLHTAKVPVQITGQILAGGQPVSGRVNIFMQSETPTQGHDVFVKSVQADAAGNYRIFGLEPGTYFLEAEPAYGDQNWVRSVRVPVTYEGQALENLNLMLTEVQMEGTVITPSGAPLTHASVEIREKMMEGGQWQHTMTDENGRYKFGNLKQGVTYEILVHPEPGSEYVQLATLVEFVYQGQRTTVPAISVILPNMEGTVFTSFGTPAAHTDVMITDVPEPGTHPKYHYNVFTDEYGHFRTFLPDGTYQLQAFSNNADEADTQPMMIIVQNGVVNNAAPQLVFAKALVKGQVLNEAGQPMQFGHVQLQDANGQMVAHDNLNHNGEFAIGNVPDGTYTLRFEQFSPENDEVLTPVPVTIVNQTPVNLNTLHTAKVPVQITGQILAGGQPVSGRVNVFVQADPTQGHPEFVKSVQADAAGNYRIFGLEPGTYYLEAEPGFEHQDWLSSVRVPVTVDGQVLENLNLNLNRVQLTGSVLAPDGTFAIDANVGVNAGANETGNAFVRNDYNGHFKVAGLVEGLEYRLFVGIPPEKNWLEPIVPVTFTYQAGMTLPAIQLEQVHVRGRLVDPYGNPVEFPHVWVRDMGDQTVNHPARGVTPYGDFKVGGLVVGRTYQLVAPAPQGSGWLETTSETFVFDGNMIDFGTISLKEQVQQP